MIEEQAREDIAFIRQAIEEGHNYATASGPDMLVWGITVAIGHLGSYGYLHGWSPVDPGRLWAVCIGLPWLYSLRGALRRLVDGGNQARRSPMVMALRMLWLGCGIFLTTLALAAVASGEIRLGWFNAVVAGVLGVALFASAWLSNLPWLRWIALAWWAGELAVYALRHRPEAPLLSAALMLLLLAGPGLVLVIRRSRQGI